MNKLIPFVLTIIVGLVIFLRFFLLVFAAALAIVASAGKVALYRNTAGLYLTFFPIAAGIYYLFNHLTKP